MKVKKFLRVLHPDTVVVIRESNHHKVEQGSARAILSYYPQDYGTWLILNKKIGSVNVSRDWVCIDLREEKNRNESR